jgi:hypothetical protein
MLGESDTIMQLLREKDFDVFLNVEDLRKYDEIFDLVNFLSWQVDNGTSDLIGADNAMEEMTLRVKMML